MSRGKSLVIAAAALGGILIVSGCGTTTEGTETTTDGVTSTFNTFSDVTSSTTPDSSKKAAFIESRFAAIRYEAARGQGEHLDALAVLLGEQDRAGFGAWMKRHYAELFDGLEQPGALLHRIDLLRAAG